MTPAEKKGFWKQTADKIKLWQLLAGVATALVGAGAGTATLRFTYATNADVDKAVERLRSERERATKSVADDVVKLDERVEKLDRTVRSNIVANRIHLCWIITTDQKLARKLGVETPPPPAGYCSGAGGDE